MPLSFREEAEPRADVVREADIVIVGDEGLVRAVEEDPGIELARRQIEPVGHIIGAAGHLDHVELAGLGLELEGVGLAGEAVDVRSAGIDESEGDARRDQHGVLEGRIDHVGRRLQDDVERIFAGQAGARIGLDVDEIGAGISGGEGEQRVGARAAVIVEIDQGESVVEQEQDRIGKRVGAGPADRDHIGLAGDDVEREDVEIAGGIDRVGQEDGVRNAEPGPAPAWRGRHRRSNCLKRQRFRGTAYMHTGSSHIASTYVC